eukprot:TRINITY_DN5694_c0_g1_i1.p1 TRINITY_DN5694_c0_g1~~TRINITY_DN5694_c0_g1_i1.p1  ORF type:complete len:482 (-),score=145.44 TRINITY_DN5694_c0_g1_i1:5-1411(-)
MFVLTTILTIAVLPILAFIYFWKAKPLPEGSPPIINPGLKFFSFFTDVVKLGPEAYFRKMQEEHGDVFVVDLFFVKLVVLATIEGQKFFYKQPDTIFSFPDLVNRQLEPVIGDLNKKRSHERDQEMTLILKGAIDAERPIFFDYIKELSEETFNQWAQKDSIDLEEEADKLINYINIRCFVGEEGYQHKEKIGKMYADLEKNGFTFLAQLFPALPFGPAGRNIQIRKEMAQILKPMVEKRKAQSQEFRDYLNGIVNSRLKNGDPIPEEDIYERSTSVFFAARVNTYVTFLWVVINMAYQPYAKYLKEPLQELEDVGGLKGPDVLSSLKAWDRIRMESIRIASFVIGSQRWTMVDSEFENSSIPKDTVLTTLPILYNNDPTVFPEPKKFQPERWTSGNVPSHVLVPFGNGQHRCKGEQFALMVLKVCWSVLFSKFQVELIGDLPKPDYYQLNPGPIMPDRKVRIRVTKK